MSTERLALHSVIQCQLIPQLLLVTQPLVCCFTLFRRISLLGTNEHKVCAGVVRLLSGVCCDAESNGCICIVYASPGNDNCRLHSSSPARFSCRRLPSHTALFLPASACLNVLKKSSRPVAVQISSLVPISLFPWMSPTKSSSLSIQTR